MYPADSCLGIDQCDIIHFSNIASMNYDKIPQTPQHTSTKSTSQSTMASQEPFVLHRASATTGLPPPGYHLSKSGIYLVPDKLCHPGPYMCDSAPIISAWLADGSHDFLPHYSRAADAQHQIEVMAEDEERVCRCLAPPMENERLIGCMAEAAGLKCPTEWFHPRCVGLKEVEGAQGQILERVDGEGLVDLRVRNWLCPRCVAWLVKKREKRQGVEVQAGEKMEGVEEVSYLGYYLSPFLWLSRVIYRLFSSA